MKNNGIKSVGMKRAGFALFVMLSVVIVACAQDSKKAEKKGEPKSTIYLTTEDFKAKVYDYEKNPNTLEYLGDKPAIVDFYATWCGPCKQLSPILEKLAKEYEGKIYIYKVDVDKEVELATKFGVSAVPTLLFIPMKGQPTIVPGAPNQAQMREILPRVLGVE